MSQLMIDGHIIDVDIEELYTWSVGNLINSVDLVGAVYTHQQWGQPAVSEREYLPILDRTLAQLAENEGVIEDSRVVSSINAVYEHLREFIHSARDLIQWQKEYIPSSRINQHEDQIANSGNFELPEWINSPDYQDLLDQASATFLRYLDSLDVVLVNVKDIASDLTDAPYLDQLKKVESRIPALRLMAEVGFVEAFKRLGNIYQQNSSA